MPTTCLHTSRTPAEPLAALLEQLSDVLGELSDEQFVERRTGGVSGSIGGHVRHLLDHVGALIDAGRSGELSYDARRRGTEIEQRRQAAREEIRRLAGELAEFARLPPHLPVNLVATLETAGGSLTSGSTIGRELAFVISHTIHHFAVIALLLWQMGVSVPARFGYAPSTPSAASDAA